MDKISKFLHDNYNYNPEIKDALQTYISQWKSWYVGNVKNFHNYYIYNGQKKVNKKRFTMNMAKEISEDWADILWSEKCSISFKDENSQDQFDKLVNELDLYALINQSIEKSGALGTCGTVVSVYDIIENDDAMTLDVSEAKTRVDVVDIESIFPLSWNNKTISECAFASVEYVNGNKYIILSVHKKAEDGNYHIYNHLFLDVNDNLSEIKEQSNTFKDFNTQSNVKWFSVFKPLLTNNLFNNSPFGIPHFANAIDQLKTVDICFDALKSEVNDGRRRTFVRTDMLNYDNGEQRLTFDPEETDIYVLPSGATKDDLIQNDTATLRTGEQISSLNTSLNILGNKVGFGDNHYTYDGSNLTTATAVISANSKLFRRKKKLEVGYESSIFDLVMAICYASSKFGMNNITTDGLVIQFDDSIIEDKESESLRAFREVNGQIISRAEYRQKIFGETPEIAQQKIREIDAEQESVVDIVSEEE